MLEKYLRPQVQRILVDNLAKFISKYLSAIQLTMLAGLFGLLVFPLLFRGSVVCAVISLFLSGLCDMLDGTVARINQSSTPWGSALDIVMDRIVEITVVLALFLVAPYTRGTACLFMLSSMLLCITTFLVVGIFTANDSHKSFHYSDGLMERAEAFIFFIGMMCWPNYFFELSYLFSALVLWTAAIRLKEFYNANQ